MATHSSILAWKIRWTEEPGGLQSTGSQEVKHDCETEHTYAQTQTHRHTDTHTHGLYWLMSLSSHHFLEAFHWWAYTMGGPSSSYRVQPPAAVKQVFLQPANIQSIQTVSWFFVLLKIIKPFVSNQKGPG